MVAVGALAASTGAALAASTRVAPAEAMVAAMVTAVALVSEPAAARTKMPQLAEMPAEAAQWLRVSAESHDEACGVARRVTQA